jgi:peptidoglycan hydrolase-like protein with peptidoglycan-binding domain
MAGLFYIGKGSPIGHPVRELQRTLTRAQFPVTDDGRWGPETRGAVVAFQRANSLEPDGKAGPVTWSQLAAKNVLAGGDRVGRDALYTLIGLRNELAVFAVATEDQALLSVVGEVDARLVALAGRPLTEAPVGVQQPALGFAPLVLAVGASEFASAAVAAAGWTAATIAAAWAAKKIAEAAEARSGSYPNKRKPYSGELRRGGGKPPLRADLEVNGRSFLKAVARGAAALAVWTGALVGYFAKGVAAKAGSAAVGIIVALVAAAFALGRRKG